MRCCGPDQDRGVALFLVLISLLLVTAIGMGMLLSSGTETNIDANYRDEQVALFAAKAGLQEARDRMLPTNANPITLPTVLPGGAGAYLTYITATNPSPVSPWSSTDPYQDTEILKELGIGSLPSTAYTSTTTVSNYSGPSSNPLPYQWIRVNLKVDNSAYTTGTPYYVNQSAGSADAGYQVCFDWYTNHEVAVAAGGCTGHLYNVYEITSYAVTPSGTHRMLQEEVAPLPPLPPLPGALTVCGPNVDVTGWPTSANWVSTGVDSAVPAQPSITGIADCSAASEASLIAGSASGKNPPTGSPAACPPAASSICNTSATMGPCLQSCTCLLNLVAMLQSSATNINPGCGNLGTAAAPAISFFDSSHDPGCAGGTNGYGILVATGNVTFTGNATFNGVMLIIGNGSFSFKGTNTFEGGIFVANTTTCPAALGTPTILGAGGGVGIINYNSADMNIADKLVAYKMLVAREMYQF